MCLDTAHVQSVKQSTVLCADSTTRKLTSYETNPANPPAPRRRTLHGCVQLSETGRHDGHKKQSEVLRPERHQQDDHPSRVPGRNGQEGHSGCSAFSCNARRQQCGSPSHTQVLWVGSDRSPDLARSHERPGTLHLQTDQAWQEDLLVPCRSVWDCVVGAQRTLRTLLGGQRDGLCQS